MSDPQFPNHDDRAVKALIDDGWTGEWDTPTEPTDLVAGAALVLRVIRDDIVSGAGGPAINDVAGVEAWLNARIRSLTGDDTTTGDTLVR